MAAGAALQRFDAQIDLAELSGAAALLLVAVVALGRRGDRLAVGDARRPRVDLELVGLLHALEQHAQVQLAEAVDDGLVGGGHMLDLQARVLVDQLGQDLPHALLVAAALGRDGQAMHRHRKVQRLQVNVVVLGGVVQHRVEVDFVHLGHRADVAGQPGEHVAVPDGPHLAPAALERRDTRRAARPRAGPADAPRLLPGGAMARRIYSFGGGKAEGGKDMKVLLGGKGAGLHEMSSIGIPVPPGFTITTEVCTAFYAAGKRLPRALEPELRAALARGETSGGLMLFPSTVAAWFPVAPASAVAVYDRLVALLQPAPIPVSVRDAWLSGLWSSFTWDTSAATQQKVRELAFLNAALETGIELAVAAKSEGVTLLGTGDMGIANTTPSSAIIAALSGISVRELTHRGTGINDESLKRKIQEVMLALWLERRPRPAPPRTRCGRCRPRRSRRSAGPGGRP